MKLRVKLCKRTGVTHLVDSHNQLIAACCVYFEDHDACVWKGDKRVTCGRCRQVIQGMISQRKREIKLLEKLIGGKRHED